MSFFASESGKGFEAGYFLVNSEDCDRVTMEISSSHAQVVTNADGTKYVPAGAIIPSNTSSAVGILYENIDVSNGNMPGSVVVRGHVYGDLLPAAAESDAKTAMVGIKFTTNAPAIYRPVFNRGELAEISVTSAAGTASGDTKLTISGYTPGAGEKYYVKAATGTAPAVVFGQPLGDGWTAWNGTADVTAATDKKLTVASVDSAGLVVAAGNCTVTAHA